MWAGLRLISFIQIRSKSYLKNNRRPGLYGAQTSPKRASPPHKNPLREDENNASGAVQQQNWKSKRRAQCHGQRNTEPPWPTKRKYEGAASSAGYGGRARRAAQGRRTNQRTGARARRREAWFACARTVHGAFALPLRLRPARHATWQVRLKRAPSRWSTLPWPRASPSWSAPWRTCSLCTKRTRGRACRGDRQ